MMTKPARLLLKMSKGAHGKVNNKTGPTIVSAPNLSDKAPVTGPAEFRFRNYMSVIQ